MQTNNSYPNRFQYASGSGNQKAPLRKKVAAPRVEAAQPQPQMAYFYQPSPQMLGQMLLPAGQIPQQAAPKGLFGKLKERIYHMVTEETSSERPIGISQLTRKTFNVRQEVAHQSVFKNGQTQQDYRFNPFIQPTHK